MALRLATACGFSLSLPGPRRLWLASLCLGLGSLLAGCAHRPELLTVRASSPEVESLPADSQSNAEAGVAKLGTARVQTTP
ncbi:MAG: hypothetical protein ACKOJF_10495, partial [Planctomycetaceae bacterium]